jgi:hypothetical protein
MGSTPGGLPQGWEIVSEYSNAWIDMRHDNALNIMHERGVAALTSPTSLPIVEHRFRCLRLLAALPHGLKPAGSLSAQQPSALAPARCRTSAPSRLPRARSARSTATDAGLPSSSPAKSTGRTSATAGVHQRGRTPRILHPHDSSSSAGRYPAALEATDPDTRRNAAQAAGHASLARKHAPVVSSHSQPLAQYFGIYPMTWWAQLGSNQ